MSLRGGPTVGNKYHLLSDKVVMSQRYNWLKTLVDVAGIEPATPCLQSRCSPS
jgi:hypothetical protein